MSIIKFCQTLQPDFNLEFGPRSSKSSPRPVYLAKGKPLSRVLLWKSSAIESDSLTNLLTRFKDLLFSKISVFNAMNFLRRLCKV